MSDGTFGTTAEQGPLDPEIVEAVELHRFDPLTRLNWRNTRLRFDSVGALLKSLDERPSLPGLVQAREATTTAPCRRSPAITKSPNCPPPRRGQASLGSLPDPRFSQGYERQPRAAARPYLHSSCRPGRTAADRLDRRADGHLDRVEGDIDTLMVRIAHIRTWTYIAHRGDWLKGRRLGKSGLAV